MLTDRWHREQRAASITEDVGERSEDGLRDEVVEGEPLELSGGLVVRGRHCWEEAEIRLEDISCGKAARV